MHREAGGGQTPRLRCIFALLGRIFKGVPGWRVQRDLQKSPHAVPIWLHGPRSSTLPGNPGATWRHVSNHQLQAFGREGQSGRMNLCEIMLPKETIISRLQTKMVSEYVF